jgi:hypothetical protein
MRQIGSRQEASRLGGIGSCGRELCCSTWLTDFRSVSTSAARYQQLALNPLKLAGQCGKLKCCLNFELDTYLDEIKDFPETDQRIKTKRGDAFHQKTDIFKRMMWFSYVDEPGAFIPLEVDAVKEIYGMNKKGVFPDDLKSFIYTEEEEEIEHDYENVVGQDSLTRFDNKKKKKKRKKPAGANNSNTLEAKPAGNQNAAPKEPRKPQQDRPAQPRNKEPRPPQANQGAGPKPNQNTGGNAGGNTQNRNHNQQRRNNNHRKGNNPQGGAPASKPTE